MDPIVIGKKIKKAYPQYTSIDDATIGTKYLQKYGGAISGIQSGNLKITDIPEASRVGVSLGLDASSKPLTADEKKKQDALNASINFVDTLEKRFQAGGLGETNLGPLTRVLGIGKDVEGTLGLNKDINVYNREKKGFAATLKTLTGDTGVLTEQDFKRLAGLVPDTGSTAEESTALFNDLRQQLSAKFGGETTKTSFKPKIKNALQAVLPETAGFIEGIGKQRQDLQELAKTNPQVAQEQANIAGKQYLQVGQNPLGALLSGNPKFEEVIKPTAEISGDVIILLAGAGLIKGTKSTISKLLGMGAGKARDEAAKGLIANTKPIIEAGDNYVKNINPAAQKAWDVLKPALKEKTDVSTLLKMLTDWGNKAYTTSGNVRAISEGQLKNYLYQAGRKTIEESAPRVAELTSQIGHSMAIKKLLGKSIVPAAVGAGASALIYKLFFGNNSN